MKKLILVSIALFTTISLMSSCGEKGTGNATENATENATGNATGNATDSVAPNATEVVKDTTAKK